MKYLGIDIGGTNCAVSMGEEINGQLVIEDKRIIPTQHNISAYAMIDKMCVAAEEITDDFSKIGISCGGPLDSKRGIILSPPNLIGWDNIEIVDYLKNKYAAKVAIQNDANACAVAEWKYGAGKGTRNMIFLTFGSGMGAGLILNGQLYSGTNDMAGEVGHMRLNGFGPVGYGKSGSFEGFCSGNGIAELGRIKALEKLQMGKSVSYCNSREEIDLITAKSIAECAMQGNYDAKEVYHICGEKLGQGLSVLIDILNPEMIVIGSVFQRSEILLREAMEETIRKESLSLAREVCKIVPAALTENIGDYAALSIAAMIE